MGFKKNIGIWIYTKEERIYVMRHKKMKLTEMYPQRAILEELRKESKLIQANDWIDHNYYEDKVEEMPLQIKKMNEKYGVVMPKQAKEQKITPRYKVPDPVQVKSPFKK